MSAALSRIILYLAVMFLPFLGVATFHLKTQDVYLYNPGRCFAQLAFAIMLLQVVLACRLHPSGEGKIEEFCYDPELITNRMTLPYPYHICPF